jgi:hypothetical protein
VTEIKSVSFACFSLRLKEKQVGCRAETRRFLSIDDVDRFRRSTDENRRVASRPTPYFLYKRRQKVSKKRLFLLLPPGSCGIYRHATQ